MSCDCVTCREYAAAKARVWREKRAARLDELPAGRHGLFATYVNWGCRCDPCREASNAYHRQWARNTRERHASRG